MASKSQRLAKSASTAATKSSHLPRGLIVAVAFVTIVGLLIHYSLGLRGGTFILSDFYRQSIAAAIGAVVLILLTKLDYRIFKDYANLLYIIAVASLLLVDVIGATRLGATRWISIGLLQIQPSEFAKLFSIIFFAQYISQHQFESRSWKVLLKSIGLLAVPALLVLAQPDLGTASVFVACWLAIVLASKLPKLPLVIVLLVGLLMLPLGYRFLAPYQKQRVDSFLSAHNDKQGSGYNVKQAQIAIGSGGMWGRGLMAGSQSEGNFLPSHSTDFVFAVVSEKLGFLGSSLLVLALYYIVAQILLIGFRAADWFGTLLCVGIATMLFIHVTVNVGMNLGLLPVTGIPLAFVSLGGSSLIVMLASVGLSLSVAARSHRLPRYQEDDRVVY